MDNLPAPSRELVRRFYKKNIELGNKPRKTVQASVPTDPNAWQEMRENYEAIFLEDSAFSEKHEIEYSLWQLHYKRIEELRAHFAAVLAAAASTPSGGKGPPRLDQIKKIRSQFKTFLSEATGFYHELILKIRAKYGLPLGDFSEDPQKLNTSEADRKFSEVKKGLMSCHRCLIYLGDLARYKGLYGEGDSKTREFAAASSYYMQAASLWSSSGNPHHQLAILASYSGDDLGSIYRYFRSLAVDNPFTTARDNLIVAFEKNRQSYSQLPGDPNNSTLKTVALRKPFHQKVETSLPSEDIKVEGTSIYENPSSITETYKSFCIRFVRMNGILFTRTSLETFDEVFCLVRRDLKVLLSSGAEEQMNFGTQGFENELFVVRLVAILIFTVDNVNREVERRSYAEILQCSVLLQNALTSAFEIMRHILKRCIQLRDPSSSYLLPSILVFIEWLSCHPGIAAGRDVEEKHAIARSSFWKHCILLLNKLLSSEVISVAEDADETFFNMSIFDEAHTDNVLALWEDYELRGFVPLYRAHFLLDFPMKYLTGIDRSARERRARVQRILVAGKVLTNCVQIENKQLHFDYNLKKFAIEVKPEVTGEETYELESNGTLPPFPEIDVAELLEEEEEEIVFKPMISERPTDVSAPKSTAYDVIGSGPTITSGEWTRYAGATSAPLSNFSFQNGYDATSKPPLASFGMPSQNQHPVITGVSWLADQQAYLVNGVNNLNIYGYGFAGDGLGRNAEVKHGFGSSQPHVFAPPFSRSVNHSGNHVYTNQILAWEAVIPSKIDSVKSSSFNADSKPFYPSSAFQAGIKKNPVSRPVRQFGPPPGFSVVPPKQADEIKAGAKLENENPPADDYSWLDGYHLSSAAKGLTQNNSISHTSYINPHVRHDNSSLTSMLNFPFPGKQVPAVQVQDETQNIWQDHRLMEQLKTFQEQLQQQQQLLQVNQPYALLPEQYQGQSLWSDCSFV